MTEFAFDFIKCFANMFIFLNLSSEILNVTFNLNKGIFKPFTSRDLGRSKDNAFPGTTSAPTAAATPAAMVSRRFNDGSSIQNLGTPDYTGRVQ